MESSHPAKLRRAAGLVAGTVASALLLALPVQAMSFNRVVSLGDSLLDDGGGSRSPVVSQHIASRLGVPLTRLAQAGATTSSLISGGQHTTAAANFGPGDLAVLWIGGNDFAAIGVDLALGNFSGLDAIEANVDLILTTLRGAGMDVVMFNLFDLATVPSVLDQFPPIVLPNGTAASANWRARLAALGVEHDVAVADIFTLYQQIQASPQSFAIAGTAPVLGPSRGSKATCPLCIWRDSIHPSSLGQGYIANRAFADMNAYFDPQQEMPLQPLSEAELIALAGAFTPATVTPTPTVTMTPTATATPTPDVSATCPPAPAEGCVVATRGRLAVRETRAGRESLKVQLAKFDVTTNQGNFGDPVAGTSSQAICVFDGESHLVAELKIDRGGDDCGRGSCWREVSSRGFRYADRDAQASGITRAVLTSGDAGRGSINVLAKNREPDQLALPAGIAAALEGTTTAATVQFFTNDAACFHAELDTVMRNRDTQFTAVRR